jgi:hypothetical protein
MVFPRKVNAKFLRKSPYQKSTPDFPVTTVSALSLATVAGTADTKLEEERKKTEAERQKNGETIEVCEIQGRILKCQKIGDLLKLLLACEKIGSYMIWFLRKSPKIVIIALSAENCLSKQT